MSRNLLQSLITVSRTCLQRQYSFKSSISIDKLYPNSQVKPFIPPSDLTKEFTGYVPVEKLEITYSRSSGPGGQHVNTASTKVDVRFHVKTATWLPEETKTNILNQYHSQITKEGYIVVRSDKTRSKHLNLADAMNKLRTLIWKSIEANKPKVVDPENEEYHRKLKEKNNRIRLIEKRHQSMIRRQRQCLDF